MLIGYVLILIVGIWWSYRYNITN